jgi:hypothetical protein
MVTVEEGHEYRTRSGKVATDIIPSPLGSTTYPWAGKVDGVSKTWSSDGRYDTGYTAHSLDLVEDVTKPEPAPLPIDKPVTPIDQMTFKQYQKGVDAIWNSFKLLP